MFVLPLVASVFVAFCVSSGKNCHNCLPSHSNSCSNTTPASNDHSPSEASLDSPNSLFVPSDTQLPHPAVDGGYFDPTNHVAPISWDLPVFRRIQFPRGLLLPISSPQDFHSAVEFAYDKIVCWRSNLFKLPVGNTASLFVQKPMELFDAYASDSAIEGYAIKAAMLFPALILQKAFLKSKPKDHLRYLE